jgi:hypothetical protein
MADDAVRDLRRKTDEGRTERGDPDGDVGAKRRLRALKLAEVELVVRAIVARQLAGVRLRKRHARDVDDFAQVRDGLAVRHAEEAFAPGADAGSQAEREAAAADAVEIDGSERSLEGAAGERERDAGRETGACRDGGRGGKRDERRAVDLRGEQPLQA